MVLESRIDFDTVNTLERIYRRAPGVFIGQGRFSEARAQFLLVSNKQ